MEVFVQLIVDNIVGFIFFITTFVLLILHNKRDQELQERSASDIWREFKYKNNPSEPPGSKEAFKWLWENERFDLSNYISENFENLAIEYYQYKYRIHSQRTKPPVSWK